MINRRIQENIILVVLLAIFIALFTMSFGYGPRARLVPLPIACLAIVLLLAQLYWENFRPADDLKMDMMEVVGADKNIAEVEVKFSSVMVAALPEDTWTPRVPTLRQEASAYGMVLALVGLLMLVGPLPAVFIFTSGYLGLSKQSTWLRSAAIGFSCAAFLYITFGFALGQKLNHGLMAPIIDQYIHF